MIALKAPDLGHSGVQPVLCRNVKEEEGAAPPKGSNSLSGRELRALMRSNQERDAGTVDTKPGSTKGEPHLCQHSGNLSTDCNHPSITLRYAFSNCVSSVPFNMKNSLSSSLRPLWSCPVGHRQPQGQC